MAVKIRLRRTGARHQPSYRLVVADSHDKRDGRFIENIGHYNPRRHDEHGEPELYIDPDRAIYWLDQGAEPTDTARSLLRKAQILDVRQAIRRGVDVTDRLNAMRRKPVEAPQPADAATETASAEA